MPARKDHIGPRVGFFICLEKLEFATEVRAVVTIGWVLARTQPGELVELVRRNLLSSIAVRELAEEAPPAAEWLERGTVRLMQHDSYRRVKGAVRQVRWGA